MASLPRSCTLAPSSYLKQSHKIVPNPTFSLFNFLYHYIFETQLTIMDSSPPVSCTLAPSSHLKQSHKIVPNPTSSLFNLVSYNRKNKHTHFNGFRVSAKANYSVLRTDQVSQTITEVVENAEEVVVENARKTCSDEQWEMALDTLLSQIKNIRRKIETHFIAKPDEAKPMLAILEDVKSLVEIHKVNRKLRNPIPTTDAIITVANHFQAAYKYSEREDGVIPVDPKPKRSSFSPVIDMFTEVANLLYGQRGPPKYLQGKFAPVSETRPTEIQVVEGKLPPCIRGMLIRNGPNPQFDPLAKYQLMDGDGMLHATIFKDEKTTYTARYVQTSRFKQEGMARQAEFPKYGDYTGAFGVFSAFTQLLKSIFVLDTSYGCGVANENVVYHAGLLLALEDFDRPYAIKIKEDGDIETLGIYDFKNKLSHNCTPHIKKDPETGELFVFGTAFTEPYVTYRVVAPDGCISDSVPIKVSGPTYMHDFCITKKYVIIMDLPFTFDPEAMLKNDDWIYNLNPSKKSCFGIRSRDPKDNTPIKWFEFEEPFFIYHNANAWEDGDKVVLYGCKLEAKVGKDDKVPFVNSILRSSALVGEHVELSLPKLYKFTFDLNTAEATQERVAGNEVEYPKINEKYWARKSRYVYTSEFEHVDKALKNHAIIKYDLEADELEGRVKRGVFGPNIVGSEVVFVPSSENATEEDDGYLLSYVHDEAKGKSYVYVICAKEMKKVAALELPNRVPYGFHAIFVKEDELLEHQRAFKTNF